MFALLRVALITTLCLFGLGRANAVTVQDEQGSFTLDTPPQRIVVLELSFADALAAIDVSPVGIADDNDPDRILSEIREHLKSWHSVGTRAQPSLEAISALKPDLIIADSSRHSGIYTALKAIAPVLLLKSRNETYEENLHSAEIIGKVLGKDSTMQTRLAQHRETMKGYAAQLPQGTNVVFGTSREQQFNLYSSDAYTGSVLAALGLSVPKPINNAPMASINLEQLLAINPQWLIVTHYREESIVKRWQQDTLWNLLEAQQKQQIAAVDSNAWARMRGIFAAERIGSDTVKIFKHQPVSVSSEQ
ncbi:Fe(3+) dicitrate ABC transporter substrate-binding protein FecB [Pectobacterium aquaticum]|uniref:Fe(3+) dicitrate ABC transporter substrate-binding protein FecB n=1 Tax=Pectobacterium aquaticum TaxID=2204145 RepID=UPI000E21C789|nr:Fe(3+) dicitrate ABC transporter substrate-binding protein FecB [Pectobacterium aquaticum]UEM38535.1 Fe(3+) dicitrate ABC transporter substrate-binding protein FecB [Pectobacterium aquaticum]